MIAIILAAGFSTRLYPLTKNFPKGLLPIGGKQIASFMAQDLAAQKDLKLIYLITSSCFADSYRTWIEAYYGNRITLVENGVKRYENRLGALGDLLFVLDKEKIDDDILVAPSDTLASIHIADMISSFRNRRTVTTAVYRTQDISKIAGRLGCAVLEGEKITGFIEKPASPPSPYMGVPYYIFPKETIPLIRQYRDEGNNLDSPGSIISWLIGRTPVYAHEVKGYYYDVGTVDVYRELTRSFPEIAGIPA